MEVLSYEALVTDFETKLVSQLRSFAPGAEYLEMWVPDDDPVKSILNMVEAAEAYGRSDLAVRVESATLPPDRIVDVINEVGKLGRVEARPCDGGTLIHVTEIGQA